MHGGHQRVALGSDWSRVRVYAGWEPRGGGGAPSDGCAAAGIMSDRIPASKDGLMDGGNNYLSFKCLRILCSPLLLLLNMLLG